MRVSRRNPHPRRGSAPAHADPLLAAETPQDSLQACGSDGICGIHAPSGAGEHTDGVGSARRAMGPTNAMSKTCVEFEGLLHEHALRLVFYTVKVSGKAKGDIITIDIHIERLHTSYQMMRKKYAQ